MPLRMLKSCCDVGGLVVALGAIYSFVPAILGILASLTIIVVNSTQLYDWLKRCKIIKLKVKAKHKRNERLRATKGQT